MTEVTKNVTEVAKNVCGAKNMTEVTETVTEVTKYGFRTKCMAMYGLVWLLWPCIAVYRSILQYIAVYCSLSQHIAVYRSILQYIAEYRSSSQYIAFSRGHRSKFIWSCLYQLDLKNGT